MTALPSLEDERDLLQTAVTEAAEIALSFFRANARVWTKAGNSPVSEADMAIDEFLRGRLLEARKGYGYLSEETDDDGTRLTAPRTFIVDPIDGTRAFIAGTTDWTIPLAVVENGRPLVAVLVAPAREERYQAIVGKGASRNDRPIRVSGTTELKGAALAVSNRLLKSAALAAPIEARTVFHASLAYRLARVADGRLDGAAIKPDARDWDLAAADLLLHEAGGRLQSIDGETPRYDRPDTAHGVMVAGSPGIIAALTDVVTRVIRHGL